MWSLLLGGLPLFSCSDCDEKAEPPVKAGSLRADQQGAVLLQQQQWCWCVGRRRVGILYGLAGRCCTSGRVGQGPQQLHVLYMMPVLQ